MAQTDDDRIALEELRRLWPILDIEERVASFALLDRAVADEFFLELMPRSQAAIIRAALPAERRSWIRLLPPDDAADVLQEFESAERDGILALLDESARREVSALLAYQEDQAGGLMSPRFARLRPEMSVEEAIHYVRLQARRSLETIYYSYVVDGDNRLVGVISFRELLTAPAGATLRAVMKTDLITVPDDMDQEKVAKVIAQYDIIAVPVVDAGGHIRGIVTVDDIVDVVEREATEDMHKMGGLEALDTPYLQTRLAPMLKKRAGWLSVLFLGEMLTATAMGHFEDEIARAVVLTLFLPLIISSGGNSGSQATTLVIRAMALGQLRLRDWPRVLRRELGAGLALGAILASIGLARIIAWQGLFHTYGEHAGLLAAAVSLSLLGVVTWGTLSGAMLPFALRALRLDPASASAPLVATLVDVSGLVIYFSIAAVVLHGALL